MSIHKDNATGKWRVVYRYTDWTGETHQSWKTCPNQERDIRRRWRDPRRLQYCEERRSL